MKHTRIILLALALVFTATAFAQTTEKDRKELKLRNEIQQFLKEEGFMVTYDSDDNTLNWKKEGTRYWLSVDPSNDTSSSLFYVEMHIAGLSFDSSDNRRVLLEACNSAVDGIRCSKAYLDDGYIVFSAEVWCASVESFRNIFYRTMSSLQSSKDKVTEYYSAHSND